MVQFNFTYDPGVSLEQRVGFELAAAIWSTYLTDDVTINLQISAVTNLDNGQAVGGAIPIFHEQNYGVFQAYVAQDGTSEEDNQANQLLQDGNTVDVMIDGELVDGNTEIMLTSAQAKALGMTDALVLEDGSTWDRDLVDPNALDGYILINNSYDWSYDFIRESDAPAGTLDFLTMALHEIGHALGFVSGLDGLLDVFELHSGETRVDGFTALDMFRHTFDSQAIDNPDGNVADLTLGANAHFSLDGETALATFSTGQDTTAGGDGYQASHWERFQQAVGIMDPTLGYQERTDI
ncbi:MAG: NF038122 family metalloprotease, partial [Cyanobacteria bacterium P01_G01_bin.38]